MRSPLPLYVLLLASVLAAPPALTICTQAQAEELPPAPAEAARFAKERAQVLRNQLLSLEVGPGVLERWAAELALLKDEKGQSYLLEPYMKQYPLKRDEDAARYALTMLLLAKGKPHAQAALDTLAKHPDKHQRMVFLHGVEKTGHAHLAAPMAIDLLKDDTEFEVRKAAAQIVGQAGTKEAIAALKHAHRNDKSWWVREKAVEAFAKRGDPESRAELLHAFRNDMATIMRTAQAGLIRDGKPDPELARLSLEILDDADRDDEQRWVALGTLMQLKETKAIPRVIKALQEDDSIRVRSTAAAFLAMMGTDEALFALAAAATTEKSEHVLPDIKKALGKIQVQGTPKELLKMVGGGEPDTKRLLAVYALSHRADLVRSADILPLLEKEQKPEIRLKLTEMLSAHPSPKVSSTLLELAESDPSPEIRLTALKLLPDFKNSRVIPLIAGAIKPESEKKPLPLGIGAAVKSDLSKDTGVIGKAYALFTAREGGSGRRRNELLAHMYAHDAFNIREVTSNQCQQGQWKFSPTMLVEALELAQQLPQTAPERKAELKKLTEKFTTIKLPEEILGQVKQVIGKLDAESWKDRDRAIRHLKKLFDQAPDLVFPVIHEAWMNKPSPEKAKNLEIVTASQLWRADGTPCDYAMSVFLRTEKEVLGDLTNALKEIEKAAPMKPLQKDCP